MSLTLTTSLAAWKSLDFRWMGDTSTLQEVMAPPPEVAL
jgi:hypothetical protein